MVFRLEDKWQSYKGSKRVKKSATEFIKNIDGGTLPHAADLKKAPAEDRKQPPRLLRWLGLAAVCALVTGSIVLSSWIQTEENMAALSAISEKQSRTIASNVEPVITEMKRINRQAVGAFVPKLISMVNTAENHDESVENNEEAFVMLGVDDEKSVDSLAGVEVDLSNPEMTASDKPDPFAPMLEGNSEIDPLTGQPKEKEVDVMDYIRFTGLIDGDASTEKVIVLEIEDPLYGAYSEVRKVSDKFTVMDKSIKIRKVTGDTLYLSIDGVYRTTSLVPYTEMAMSSSGVGSVESNSVGNEGGSAGNAGSTGSLSSGGNGLSDLEEP